MLGKNIYATLVHTKQKELFLTCCSVAMSRAAELAVVTYNTTQFIGYTSQTALKLKLLEITVQSQTSYVLLNIAVTEGTRTTGLEGRVPKAVGTRPSKMKTIH